MLHVGRMGSDSYEANLVFAGPFSLSYSSAPSPFLCEETDMTEILFTEILKLNLINPNKYYSNLLCGHLLGKG